MEQMAYDRSFDGALGARERKRKGSCGAAEIQLLAERKKEDGEPIAVQTGAEQAHGRRGRHHAPTVEKSGKSLQHMTPNVSKMGTPQSINKTSTLAQKN
jgi:hypothetical protein